MARHCGEVDAGVAKQRRGNLVGRIQLHVRGRAESILRIGAQSTAGGILRASSTAGSTGPLVTGEQQRAPGRRSALSVESAVLDRSDR